MRLRWRARKSAIAFLVLVHGAVVLVALVSLISSDGRLIHANAARPPTPSAQPMTPTPITPAPDTMAPSPTVPPLATPTSAATPTSVAPQPPAAPLHQRLAVPSYIYPGAGWDPLIAGVPSVSIAVINPDSGPGSSASASYLSQVQSSQRAGLKVLGYVHTQWGSRDLHTVQDEIANYFAWYHLDGILIDEAATSCDDLAYYAALSDAVRTANSRAVVVLNPGTSTGACYLSVADVIVTFEGSYDSYLSAYIGPAWAAQYPPSRTWHLIYSAQTEAQMETALHLSQTRGAGYVYVTSATLPNPWGVLPSPDYWSAELASLP